ncbi:Bartonella effector protein (Bep); substrate of VirB T4SS [Bartonella clarridgeiae 73]|uniref:Bartonella effector protein (Bep) substrate of VirB T4SS n=1 Tax=Bartonella clarridgeiae (strain CCUG 45776 / CIP 104772 / 73) TaxID=696125 RepID=E6YIM7_BARC7|nr:BID domain-containing T4SS effector [Bartonella clarridgeiae]CBI76715.1 Bartonella effector protein (Bep); substrate of VirB T4SS [Bartonella clarridgeiae 73]
MKTHNTPATNSEIYENSEIYDNPATDSGIYDTPATNSEIYDNPATDSGIYDTPATNSEIYGNPATDSGIYDTPATNSEIYENSEIYGNPAIDSGIYDTPATNSEIYENSEIYGNSATDSEIYENYDTYKKNKELVSLTKKELIIKIANDPSVQEQATKIRNLSQIVFGKSEILNNEIEQINNHPSLGKVFHKQVLESYKSFSKLAGRKIFFIKTQERKTAEENIPILSQAIKEYMEVVKHSKDKILQNYQKERKSFILIQNNFSKEVTDILNLPRNMWHKTLEQNNNINVNKELSNFLNQVNSCLSKDELAMLRNNEYKLLAKNTNIPENNAKDFILIFKKAQSLQNEINRLNQSSPQKMRTMVITH